MWRPVYWKVLGWGAAPLEYKTGTNLLKPVGAQGKPLHKHSANNKMFGRTLKLNGLRC